MVKCKYEGTGIWDGRCTGTKEVDPCPVYDKCKQYKPNYTTNADRIRSMSDKELAGLVHGFISLIYMSEKCTIRTIECETCFFKEVCTGEYFGKEIEWLQKPAE